MNTNTTNTNTTANTDSTNTTTGNAIFAALMACAPVQPSKPAPLPAGVAEIITVKHASEAVAIIEKQTPEQAEPKKEQQPAADPAPTPEEVKAIKSKIYQSRYERYEAKYAEAAKMLQRLTRAEWAAEGAISCTETFIEHAGDLLSADYIKQLKYTTGAIQAKISSINRSALIPRTHAAYTRKLLTAGVQMRKARAALKALEAEESSPATVPTVDEVKPEQPEQISVVTAEKQNLKKEYKQPAPINEDLARRAKENISFSDYKPGSATAEYNAYIADAQKILDNVLPKCKTEKQREHARELFAKYARMMADYINKENEITCRCPSVMIAGGSNFPVKKKQKQIAAWGKNNELYKAAEEVLYKLKGVHRQAIAADDPEAIEAIKAKLAQREAYQEKMKKANAEARKRDDLAPYRPWTLQNNNAEIHRLRDRLAQLEKAAEAVTTCEDVDGLPGVRLENNAEAARVRLYFDERPAPEVCELLHGEAFKWAPSVGAWQRQNTDNGIRAARRVIEKLKAREENKAAG